MDRYLNLPPPTNPLKPDKIGQSI